MTSSSGKCHTSFQRAALTNDDRSSPTVRYTPLPSSSPPPPSSPRPASPPTLRNQERIAQRSNSTGGSGVRRTPKEGGRVAAKDYPKDEKSLILAATKIYHVKIWTIDPFPDDKLQVRWAIDAWDAVADGSPMPDGQVIQYVSIFSITPTGKPRLLTNTMLSDHRPGLERKDDLEKRGSEARSAPLWPCLWWAQWYSEVECEAG